MSIFSSLFGAAATGAKFVGQTALGAATHSVGSRVALGAVAGGLYGAMSSDRNSSSGRFNDVIHGAGLGMGFGLAAGIPGLAVKAAFHAPSFARAAVRGAAATVGGVAAEGGIWALNHPKTMIGLGATAAWLAHDKTPYYSVMNDQNVQLRSTLNREADMMSDLQGALPRGGAGNYEGNSLVGMPATAIRQQPQRTFMQSTVGLVQGLNSRRH